MALAMDLPTSKKNLLPRHINNRYRTLYYLDLKEIELDMGCIKIAFKYWSNKGKVVRTVPSDTTDQPKDTVMIGHITGMQIQNKKFSGRDTKYYLHLKTPKID